MSDGNTDREFRRLLDLYADKADEELLELYTRRGDLIPLAQQALDKTMKERQLAPEAEDETPVSAGPRGELALDPAATLEPGEESLITFRDGLEASQAIDALRAAALPHRVTERTVHYTSGDSRTMLELIVAHVDAAEARAVLQRRLGLFPPPEGDDALSDEDYAPLGQFTPAQAAIVTRALDDRGIPHTAEQDDDATEADPVWISIPAALSDEAFALMEQIAETLPGEDEAQGS